MASAWEAARVKDLPVSGIRHLFERAHYLEHVEGRDVIHLEIGGPDFDTPAVIKDAAKAALDGGQVHYTSNYGLLPLRERIAAKLQRDQGVGYDPQKEIIVTVGVAQAIFLSMACFVDPGDQVLLPGPCWPVYPGIIQFMGAETTYYPLREDDGFRPDLDALARQITPKTKMVVLNSPANPTGSVWLREDLEAFARLAAKHDFLILSDEIYEKLVYDGHTHESIAAFPELRDRVLLLNGFSKAYSMTGWRLGYIAAPAPLMDVMVRTQEYVVSCTTTFAQYGAMAALDEGEAAVEEMRAAFEKRRDLVVDALRSIPGIRCSQPGGAFYAYPNVAGLGMDGDQFSAALLEEESVALVPGSVFGPGQKDYVRISFATAYDRLAEAMERIRRFVARR